MELSGKKIGFAMTGSYCTFKTVLEQLRILKKKGAELYPIVSENVSKTDTRFMPHGELYEVLQSITGREVIDTIVKAEPIGPLSLFDLLIVAPCTGNSASKIALGITDTPVIMAVKAHLRTQKPVLLAVASNDALRGCAKSIGTLMNLHNVFLVPMRQDHYQKKPASLVACMELIPLCAELALDHQQHQPVFYKADSV